MIRVGARTPALACELRSTARAETAIVFGLSEGDRGLAVIDLEIDGARPPRRPSPLDDDGLVGLLCVPPFELADRFRTLDEHHECAVATGIHRYRALICENGRFVRYAMAIFGGPPSRRQRRAMSDAVPAIRRTALAHDAVVGRTQISTALIAAVRGAGTRAIEPSRHLTELLSARGAGTRTTEVASLLAQGLDNKTIAGRLGIADNTVEYHLTKTYALLGVRSRRELLASLFVDAWGNSQ